MTRSVTSKRQSLVRLVVIAGLALPLIGCSNWPLSKDTRKDGPAEEAPLAVEAQPDVEIEEPDTETGSEPEKEPAPQPHTGPGIALGTAERDRLYATLKTGSRALAPEDSGYFVDVHEARLRQTLAGTPIDMQRTGDRILLTIPGSLSFETDSADLAEALKPILADIAAVLTEFDKTLVSVFGHTDDRGEAAYNQILSERRAMAVASFLEKSGVERKRLVGIGHGQERPAVEGDSEGARTANRRIEILLEPIVTAQDDPEGQLSEGSS